MAPELRTFPAQKAGDSCAVWQFAGSIWCIAASKAGFDVMSIDVETLAGTVWRIAAQKQDGLGIWKIHR